MTHTSARLSRGNAATIAALPATQATAATARSASRQQSARSRREWNPPEIMIARAAGTVDRGGRRADDCAGMSQSAVQLSARPGAVSHVRFAWLFSPRADLAMLLLPALVIGSAFALALRHGEDARGTAHGYAGWVTAFLLGNTSHVALTFLLLGARRDMLHATDRQARTVILGSLAVFVVSLGLMRLTHDDPWTHPLYEAVTVVFATHHTLSQAKGFWALYGLRGARVGLPPPSARERELQKLFVPIALLLIAVKWMLVPRFSGEGSTPFINVNPGEPGVLPFVTGYGLLGAWLIYVAVLFRSLLAYEALNAAKLVYLAGQCSVVTLELVSPGWGVTLSAGIHGVEYYLLTRTMLAPLPSDAGTRLTDALSWPAMIAAMSPILAVGILQNPWVPVGRSLSEGFRTWALMLVNATVLAHYCADAFIYRFRIPGVRKVAMARLGFEG